MKISIAGIEIDALEERCKTEEKALKKIHELIKKRQFFLVTPLPTGEWSIVRKV